MYTVTKLEAGKTYRKIGGLEWFARSTSWAVIAPDGNIARFANSRSGRMVDEIYNTKCTAQMSADFLNGKDS